MDAIYALLFAGHFAEVEEMWRQRSALLDAEVAVELNTGRVRGRLLQIAFSGLELETSLGETIYLMPETVRHVAHAAG